MEGEAWSQTTTDPYRARPGQRAWDAAGCSAPPPPGPGACPSTWVGPRAPSQSPRHVGRGWGGTGGPGLRDTICQHFTGVFVQPACAARGRLSLSLPLFPELRATQQDVVGAQVALPGEPQTLHRWVPGWGGRPGRGGWGKSLEGVPEGERREQGPGKAGGEA